MRQQHLCYYFSSVDPITIFVFIFYGTEEDVESIEKISGSMEDKNHYFLFSTDLNLEIIFKNKKIKMFAPPKRGTNKTSIQSLYSQWM